MRFGKLLVSSTALGLAFAIAAPATFSQENPDTESRLDTVTVSAQRLEENLQDVPVSVTQLADEKLDILSSGGADVRFLSARVPSVIAESSFGRAFPRFYIRGIGNTDFDLNASQPVSLVYDNVPYENPILKGFPVFDLEDIEVLRGPQGTLFGRNTPGGNPGCVVMFADLLPDSAGDEAVLFTMNAAGVVSLNALDAGNFSALRYLRGVPADLSAATLDRVIDGDVAITQPALRSLDLGGVEVLILP